jgi:hypothetical protein
MSGAYVLALISGKNKIMHLVAVCGVVLYVLILIGMGEVLRSGPNKLVK